MPKEWAFGDWVVRSITPPSHFAWGVFNTATGKILFKTDNRKEAISAAKALAGMEPPPNITGWPTEVDWLDRAAERTKGMKIWWQAGGGAPAMLFAPEEIVPFLNAMRDLHKCNGSIGKKRTETIKNLESLLANRLQLRKSNQQCRIKRSTG